MSNNFIQIIIIYGLHTRLTIISQLSIQPTAYYKKKKHRYYSTQFYNQITNFDAEILPIRLFTYNVVYAKFGAYLSQLLQSKYGVLSSTLEWQNKKVAFPSLY